MIIGSKTAPEAPIRYPLAVTWLRNCRAIVLGLVLFALALASRADDVSRPEAGGPVPVRVTVSVLDLDNVDSVEQSFVANVYYEARWRDARLAYGGPGERAMPLNSVWHPRLQFLNQQRVVQTLPEVVEVSPDGEVLYRQRVWGPFSQPLDVEKFPFDEQTFDLLLGPAGFEFDEVRLIADPKRPSGMAPSFSVADWRVEDFRAGGEKYPLAPGLPVPVFRVRLRAERQSAYFVLKVIVPLLLIVGMACSVFWMDPKNASTQIGVATTSMLTLIAYRFAMAGFAPPVPYLTRMDIFILGGTLVVFLILVVAVATVYLAGRGRLALALRIERHCRWGFPAVFAALSAFAFR
jgi:hypothetical protein